MKGSGLMKIPTWLTHRPVFTVEDYDQIDGHYDYNSDAKGLSLGIAQWNEQEKVKEISAKIWRHTGKRWSRQSEEMPIHLVLDLTILILETMNYLRQSYKYPKKYDPEHPDVVAVTLDTVTNNADTMKINVCTDNPSIEEDINVFAPAFGEDNHIFDERLRTIGELLKTLGYVK